MIGPVLIMFVTGGEKCHEIAGVTQGQLQEWMEHFPTDLGKLETSRDNQTIISTSFENLESCINFQN
jgi:hypothetical protein